MIIKIILLKDNIRCMYYVNKYVFKCFLNIMMLGAHLISSGTKFQSETAAVSINLFQI